MPGLLVEALTQRGHDVAYAAALAPGDGDETVLARSTWEGRVVVTADRGFGDLAVRQGQTSVGIVVVAIDRWPGQTQAVAEIAARIDELGESRLLGRLTILSPERTRQRDLPAVADRA